MSKNIKKVLITGGTGFIGSHLAELYVEKGYKVIIIDNCETSTIDNINNILDQVEYYNSNIINDEKLVDKIISKIDIVIHLAASVGVKNILDNKVHSILNNIKPTELILELCHKYNKKVLIASSSEVYGKNIGFFKEENDVIYGNSQIHRWSYAVTKLMDEFLALAYAKEKGLKVIIPRFFNIVGPRQSSEYGMVIPNFIKNALNGGDIEVYGTGQQSRSFTHVKDCVNAIYLLMESKEAEGEVVNIGSENNISILNLARKVKEITNSNSEIKIIPYDLKFDSNFQDMEQRIPDISKLKRLTNYTSLKTIEEIINDITHFSNKI